MSNYWDLGCRDCGVELQLHANHGEGAIAELAKDGPKLADVARLLPSLTIDVRENYSIYCESGSTVGVAWFGEHGSHRLAPRSEYGYYLTDCTESIRCACGAWRRCKLPENHPGDHDPDAPPGNDSAKVAG